VAVGTIICTKAGLFNIGQEGQLIVGAMCGAFVGLDVQGPSWIMLIATLLASAAGGAAWAGISGALRYWRGVDVVISTLLLTFVAFQLVTWAVTTPGVLQESKVPGSVLSPESNLLPTGVQLARIGQYPDFNVGIGCFLALALAIAVQVAMTRTRWGFRVRLLGLNREVARRTGVREWRTGGGALALSGAFAGLAGGVMLTGSVFRIQSGFSNNVGFQGLLVALVSQGSALLAIPVSLFFGALRSGGGFLASTGVPRYLVDVVQALLVLAAIFPPVFLAVMRRRRARARAAATAAIV
jgi:general nucleoside transport system permease protein